MKKLLSVLSAAVVLSGCGVEDGAYATYLKKHPMTESKAQVEMDLMRYGGSICRTYIWLHNVHLVNSRPDIKKEQQEAINATGKKTKQKVEYIGETLCQFTSDTEKLTVDMSSGEVVSLGLEK